MAQQQDILDNNTLGHAPLARRAACIVIPTTDGLVWLCGLKERSATLNSHMTLTGDFRQLAVSKAYHQFVSVPLKQIRKAESSVHIELSKPIDSGRSWEFPVLLAHMLHRDGLLAFPDLKALEAGNDPGCDLIWATGKLDADLVPVAGDYSLSQKFCLSEDVLETFCHHGRRVDVILGGPLAEDVRRKTQTLSNRLGLSFQEVRHSGEIDFFKRNMVVTKTKKNKVSAVLKRYASKNGGVAIAAFLSIIGLSFAMSSMISTKPGEKTVMAKLEAQDKPTQISQHSPKDKNTLKDKNAPKNKNIGEHIVQSDAVAPKGQPKILKNRAKVLKDNTKTAVKMTVKTVKKVSGKADTAREKPAQKAKLQNKTAATVRAKTPKVIPLGTPITDSFVIETLLAKGRSSCTDAITRKRYCLNNPQACQSLGRDKVFQTAALKAGKAMEYSIENNISAHNRRSLCGLRFKNTGQKPLNLSIDRKIAPFVFHGSNHLFRPIRVQAGQSTDLYLQRFPDQLQTTMQVGETGKIGETGKNITSLTLKF